MVDGVHATSRPGTPRVSLSRRVDRLSDGRFSMLLFLPAALLVGLFLIPPIVAVLGMALFRIEILRPGPTRFLGVGSSRVDLQACKLEYSIVSPK